MKLLQEMMSIIKTRTDEAFIRPPDPYGTKYPSSHKGTVKFELDKSHAANGSDIYAFLTKKDGIVDTLKDLGIDVQVGSVHNEVSLFSKNTKSDALKDAFEEAADDQGLKYTELRTV